MDELTKLQDSIKLIYKLRSVSLGFLEGINKYKLWDPYTSTIINSWKVPFNESVFLQAYYSSSEHAKMKVKIKSDVDTLGKSFPPQTLIIVFYTRDTLGMMTMMLLILLGRLRKMMLMFQILKHLMEV